jgi:uncharacterized OB-fold protein
MTETTLPLPDPTPLSRPFWEAARQGRLVLQRCRACGAFRWTPQYLCIRCHDEAYDWTEVSGRASLYSWTRVHRPPLPAFPAPYVVAVVELAEGPLMLTNIVGCRAEDLVIGMPLQVQFEPAGAQIALYRFRPAG